MVTNIFEENDALVPTEPPYNQFVVGFATAPNKILVQYSTGKVQQINVSKLSIDIDNALSPTSENPVKNKIVYDALNSKQEILVSGENIKTINSIPILGPGNIEIPIPPEIEVDSALSPTSTNPVQNKVIKEALDNINVDIEIDSELSATSENPVQNKIIEQALQTKIDKSEYIRKIYIGSEEIPSPIFGDDGDIYIYNPN